MEENRWYIEGWEGLEAYWTVYRQNGWRPENVFLGNIFTHKTNGTTFVSVVVQSSEIRHLDTL